MAILTFEKVEFGRLLAETWSNEGAVLVLVPTVSIRQLVLSIRSWLVERGNDRGDLGGERPCHSA